MIDATRAYLRIEIFVRDARGRTRAHPVQNPDVRIERAMGRLPGDGSFYWDDPRRAYRAAVVALREPGAFQATIETISGRPVARLYRHADGIRACSGGAP
jgi:hypothetical protein